MSVNIEFTIEGIVNSLQTSNKMRKDYLFVKRNGFDLPECFLSLSLQPLSKESLLPERAAMTGKGNEKNKSSKILKKVRNFGNENYLCSR